MKTKPTWNIKQSKFAENSVNPIRTIIENLHVEPNKDKSFIPLSIGDPTVFGNLKPCDEILNAVIDIVKSKKFNGYVASTGVDTAKQAIATYCTYAGAEVDMKDVYITSGCSHALDLIISVLSEPGKNILIPRPGFPLYRTLCLGLGVETRSYNLLPDQNWEIDLAHMESLIDSQTVAIIYNNPSNPCGSVYSRQHALAFLEVAARNCIPVIADEIYENITFGQHRFIPLASMTTEVPILSCRGISKKFLVPGWRLGWIIVYDRKDRFGQDIRKGLTGLCQRLMGANTLIQGALPVLLKNTPGSFFDTTIVLLKENTERCMAIISTIPGLKPIKPEGAMYMMIKIEIDKFPRIKNDMEFVEKLVAEQSVFCLPGSCFELANFMRIVLTAPTSKTVEACHRMAEFCKKHYRLSSETVPTNMTNGQQATPPHSPPQQQAHPPAERKPSPLTPPKTPSPPPSS